MNTSNNRQKSYNIMDDDIDNDIELQMEIQDVSDISPKLFFLQNPELELEQEYRLSPFSSVSSNSSENSKKTTYKKLTFEEVEHSIQKNLKQEKLFSELDIIITYIKGQKYIYSQSFYITQQKVHLLVFPSLFITSAIMVIAPIIQVYAWSGYLLTGLNAILTLFISILNFWNLQYIMTQYNGYATHFDRLETSLLMTRNQIYLLEDVKEQTEIILDKLRETENRMMEMKESSSILLPTEIKTQTPIICNFDIFSFIHKMEKRNKNMIVYYKDIKNEIRYIMFKWKSKDRDRDIDTIVEDDFHIDYMDNKDTFYRPEIHQNDSLKKESERNRLMYLLKEKETTKKKLLENHQKYSKIQDVFLNEILIAEKNQHNFWFLFNYYLCFFNNVQNPNINGNTDLD